MVDMTGGTGDKVELPFGMEKRENLVARATSILKNESDDEVLESVVELLENLEKNVIREGLKSFKNNGCALIRKTQRPNHDLKLQNNPTSSTMMAELKEAELKGNLESGFDQATNAMNNELILKKIFDFFSVNDLKNCRLVSKKWCDMSLKAWRGKAVLHAEALFEEDSVSDEEQKFVKNASKLLGVPFHRYDMRVKSVTQDFYGKEKIMLDFFSSSIQHLQIHCDDLELMSLLFTKLPELRDLHVRLDCQHLFRQYVSIVWKDGECPFSKLSSVKSKLRKLELDWMPSRYDLERQENFPWKKIFGSFPTLKCLRLNPHDGGRSFLQEEIIQSLCEVRREANFSILELEELTIHDLSDEVISCIAESRFPLRSVYIDVRWDNNASVIMELLEASRETLEFIKFEFPSYSDHRILLLEPYLPAKVSLPNLKELVLKNGHAFPSLICSLDTPNMKNLRIEPINDFFLLDEPKQLDFIRPPLKITTQIFRDSFILPSLRKFFCDEIWNFSKADLQIFAYALPNITDLRIPLGYTHKTFPIVCELWPGLEALHVVANEITYVLMDDYTITGFLIENYCDDICVESREFNITNLKNLKKFLLETRLRGRRNLIRPQKPWITDISAVYGFLQLPKLEILELETLCKFSQNVMLALKDHISNLKIREPDIFACIDDPASSEECDHDSEGGSDEFWD